MKRVLGISIAIAAAVAALAASASATYRGGVGALAFGVIGAGGNVDVYSIRPDGSGLKRLTSAKSFDACAAFSPDGRTIAFCSDRSGKYQIWTMRADGGGETQLTRSPYPAIFPDFSPDGRRVAFQANDGGPAGEDIYIVSSSGGKARRLTGAPGNDEYPVFSPDGRTIAFLSHRKRGTQIWLMDAADGRHQRALTRDGSEKVELDWRPDGRRIAYVAGGDIWVMDADGSRKTNLTRTPQRENGVAWSPDGRRIAYVHREGEKRRIWVMNADGSGKHAVGGAGGQLVPAWQPLR